MANQDREALLKFLDFASNRGLMKKTTAQSLKSACSAVLGILDENDAKDVFAVDLEGMFQRYENLKESEVSPSTFRAYRQRGQASGRRIPTLQSQSIQLEASRSISARRTDPNELPRTRRIPKRKRMQPTKPPI